MPVLFSLGDSPRIYEAPETDETDIRCAYVLPPGVTLAQQTISSDEMLGSSMSGSFCFSSLPFTDEVLATFDDAQPDAKGVTDMPRSIVWITSVQNDIPAAMTVALFDAAADGNLVLTNSLVFVVDERHLIAHIQAGSLVTISNGESAGLRIAAIEKVPIAFAGLAAFPISSAGPVAIDFDGASRGHGRFSFDADPCQLLAAVPAGLRYTIPTAAGGEALTPVFFDVFPEQQPAGSTRLGIHIDPFTGARNAPNIPTTEFTFEDDNAVALVSTFRNRQGQVIQLIPAAKQSSTTNAIEPATLKVASHSASTDFLHVEPSGDFYIQVGAQSDLPTCALLCGQSATEVVFLHPQDVAPPHRLRFVAGSPANAALFPLPASSTRSAPRSPGVALLDNTTTTSWIGFVANAEHPALYSAQPSESPLYGKDQLIHGHNDAWLGFVEPGHALETDTIQAAPIIPYAGARVTDAGNSDLAQFERQIIEPVRRHAFARRDAKSAALTSETPDRMTTPAGLIVSINADGSWSEVLLAKSDNLQKILRFRNLGPQLQNVFQSQQVFAVLVNPSLDGTTEFDGEVTLDGWSMRTSIGGNSEYGHYRNVLILKFCPGKLVDLARTTDHWNQGTLLSVSDAANDPAEINAVSTWLQAYFADAEAQQNDDKKQDDNYKVYDRFVDIINDETWHGVLALNIDITQVPPALGGLLGGMDIDNFFAHHLGVDINPLDGTDLELNHDSSVFGLVDYKDPAWAPAHPETPVSTQSDGIYDFRVLTLQVLFENARVKDFRSLAQLGMAELFGAKITQIGNEPTPEPALILHGRYQKQGHADSFVMETDAPKTLLLGSTALPRVHVSRIQFTTIDTKDGADNADAGFGIRFTFWGALDFAVLPAVDGQAASDLFSFGSNADSSTVGGLAFSNLTLEMSSLASEGEDRFRLNLDAVRFDASHYGPRNNSLYSGLPLQPERLIRGDEATTPAALGYLPVAGDERLVAISGSWHGISFRFDLGTPGELASHAGFEADLLLAWQSSAQDDPSTLPVQVGLKLPGTEGADVLGLQGVMKLAIGDIELIPLQQKDRTSYLLKLQDIGLSLLGLKNIPSASGTAFYLFANPDPLSTDRTIGWYAVYNPSKQSSRKVTTEDSGGG